MRDTAVIGAALLVKPPYGKASKEITRVQQISWTPVSVGSHPSAK